MQLAKIGRRPSPKRQAVDTVASVAKVWSEWQLAKRAGQGVAKGAKTAGTAAIVWRVLPVRALLIAGGAAAGIGALWAWRRRSGGAEPWSPSAADSAAPPASTGLSVPAPTAPGSGPERIKVTSDPVAAVEAGAREGSNGVTKISDGPAATPESDADGAGAPKEEPAESESEPEPQADAGPEGEPDTGAEGDEPDAEADTTKVSDKPAED